jgi:uncharacterized protein DUF1553
LALPMLAVFDAADTDASCPARFATTQPTQALAMLNSEFLNEQAKIFADDIRRHAGDNVAEQIRLALRRVTQREPTAAEIDRGIGLVEKFRSAHGLSAEAALRDFCLMAINLNEFMYLD